MIYVCTSCDRLPCTCRHIVPKPQPLDFGDYCVIEQRRYGVPNEMYVHKVVGRLNSNSWVEVPVDGAAHGREQQRHDEVVPVIAAICCGVQELEVRYYRESDCRPASRRK